MINVGPGAGEFLGTHRIPQQRESETSAFAQYSKAGTGILPDSVAQVLTELTPRYQFGYLGGFGYNVAKDRQVLDHPLDTVRTTIGLTELPSSSWMPLYDELVQLLPPDVLKVFLYQRDQVPLADRSSAYVDIDNLLKTTARVLAQLESSSQPAAPDSMENTHNIIRLLFPYVTLQGVTQNGNDMANAVYNFLAEEGANFPNFDAFINVLGQMKVINNLMQQVNEGLNDTPGGQLNPSTRETALKALELLSTLNGQLANVSLGNDLQILQTTLTAMETILTAIAQPNIALGTLYLSLSMAMIGINSAENETGIVGPDLAAVLQTLSQAVSEGLIPENEWPGAQLLSKLVTASVLIYTSLAALAVTEGIGPVPNKDVAPTAADRFFSFELIVALTVNSGVIQEIYKEAITASGGDATAQDSGSVVLAQLAHLFIILAGAQMAQQSPDSLLEDNSKNLKDGIDTAAELNTTTPDSEVEVAYSVALGQMQIAIENKDYDGLIQALDGLVESFGVPPEKLQTDIAGLGTFISDLFNVAGQVNSDEMTTGTTNVV